MQASARWFEQFGIDSDVCRQVLQAATTWGADDADLYFEHATSTSVGLSDRKVNRAHTTVDLGMGVRVVVGDQVGYAYTEDPSLPSMLAAAQTAAQAAGNAAREHGVRTLDVRVNGPGAGRESSVRALQAAGMEIRSIKDVTPIPHNGCRPPKRRRV